MHYRITPIKYVIHKCFYLHESTQGWLCQIKVLLENTYSIAVHTVEIWGILTTELGNFIFSFVNTWTISSNSMNIKETATIIPAVWTLQFRSRHSSAPAPYKQRVSPSTSTKWDSRTDKPCTALLNIVSRDLWRK